MDKSATVTVTTPSPLEVAITRVFNAPRRMVYDAHTKPELLARWLVGPGGWSLVQCEQDLREGGAWRWVMHGPGGAQMVMHGVHLEVVPPERVVRTELFEPAWYEGVARSTMVLTESGAKTTLTVTVRYETEQTRDAALKSHMTGGMSSNYLRLDELLAQEQGA